MAQSAEFSKPHDRWRDWVAVERAIEGRDPVKRPLSKRERHEVVHRLAARGADVAELTSRLGMSWDTVRKILDEEAA